MNMDLSLIIEKKPLISICIPVLNESENLNNLITELYKLTEDLKSEYDFEFIFSDNHSDDETWLILEEYSKNDPRVKAIRFGKNIGFQKSIYVNYLHSKGDAVIQLDADLQDPPELIKDFLDKWKQGYNIVYGIRIQREEHFLINAFRKIGYWFIDKVSEYPIPRDAGDFRLIDRKVINALRKVKYPSPYLRGMIANFGFKQIGIPYKRDARKAGASKFNIRRLLSLGFTAVINHSLVPLRIGSYLGFSILIFSIIGSIYYILLKLYYPFLPRGLASIHILVLFGIGLNALLLGLIGEYIMRIFLILRAEPFAVIEQSFNFDAKDLIY